MRIRHTSAILVLSALLPDPAAAQAVVTGSITALAQERVVTASASGATPVRKESVDMGPFAETASATGWTVFCAGICVTLPVSGSAAQRSLLTVTQHALELRASMSASGISVPRAGGGSGTARVRSTFAVETDVPYILESEGSGGTSVVLEDAQGQRIEEHVNRTEPIAHRGRLTAGSYTLTAQTSPGFDGGALSGSASLDVRFTAGGAAVPRPRCIIELTAPHYRTGEVVKASRLEVANQHVTRPVELKVWLRRPDVIEVPAHNAGADGSVAIPEGTTQNFGPLDVMGVDDATERGLYEFGCRLLNPITGEQLDEDSDLFEVR